MALPTVLSAVRQLPVRQVGRLLMAICMQAFQGVRSIASIWMPQIIASLAHQLTQEQEHKSYRRNSFLGLCCSVAHKPSPCTLSDLDAASTNLDGWSGVCDYDSEGNDLPIAEHRGVLSGRIDNQDLLCSRVLQCCTCNVRHVLMCKHLACDCISTAGLAWY